MKQLLFICSMLWTAYPLGAQTTNTPGTNAGSPEAYVLEKRGLLAPDSLLFTVLAPSLAVGGWDAATRHKAAVDSFLALTGIDRHQKKSMRHLKKLYTEARRHFLKDYRETTLVADALTQGQYDCLSGTLLLAYLLHETGYDYQAYETGAHAFLKVFLHGREILIESTDPVYGIFVAPAAINAKIASFSEKYPDSYPPAPIGIVGLAGLQYYNLAVAQFNRRQYVAAHANLTKGMRLEPGIKNRELALLLGGSLALAR